MDLGRRSGSLLADTPPVSRRPVRTFLNVFILCTVNVLNYCDRFILAAILPSIQHEMHIKNDIGGLFQSVFIVCYTLVAPLWGFCGDRFNRNMLMAVSLLLWNCAHLCFSFVDRAWALLMIRGVFGVGQAGFTTVAPSILGDLYQGPMRSRMLVVFFLAIPVGQGLGYIIGTQMNEAFNNWRWALRVTPGITLLMTALVVLCLQEPVRSSFASAEGEHSSGSTLQRHTSWVQDVRYLSRNASYVLTTLAFLCSTFMLGAVGWWGPKIFLRGYGIDSADTDPKSKERANLILTIVGIVAMFSGLLGVIGGYLIGFGLKRHFPTIDPFICGLGMVASVPSLIGCLFATSNPLGVSCAILSVGLILSNLNWAITVDILLLVVVPNRRSLAMGVQLFVGHSFGDAISPYLMGYMAEAFELTMEGDNAIDREFKALRMSFMIVSISGILSGICFFVCCCFIQRDMNSINPEEMETPANPQTDTPPLPSPSSPHHARTHIKPRQDHGHDARKA